MNEIKGWAGLFPTASLTIKKTRERKKAEAVSSCIFNGKRAVVFPSLPPFHFIISWTKQGNGWKRE